MRMHHVLPLFGSSKRTLSVTLLALVFLLSACGSMGVGTVPRGTPDTGNGTPAVVATVTTTLNALPTAPATMKGSLYTFVRADQLWVALANREPVQMTHFSYTERPDAFWRTPVWSPNKRYIAFLMGALPVGLGGGGCPGPDYTANGGLYILDTQTKQFTALTLPGPKVNYQAGGAPLVDYWRYMAWEDTTHLLAWYNGSAGKTNAEPGLYRYDVTTHKLSQVFPLRTLGATMFPAPQKGLPILLSVRYSSGQLFYQLVERPFERDSQLVIYQHSVAKPLQASKKLVLMGSEPWCADQQPGAFIKPGWDVSPDGGQLVSQIIIPAGAGQGVSVVRSRNLQDGSETDLFGRISTDLLGYDLGLTWGPDSQSLVATSSHVTQQSGPFSTSLANPAVTQHYTPGLTGQVSWRADGTAFALQSVEDLGTDEAASDVFVFSMGDPHGRLLLAHAHEFAWG